MSSKGGAELLQIYYVPHRLAWSRTTDFRSVNWGSNPHGVKFIQRKAMRLEKSHGFLI